MLVHIIIYEFTVDKQKFILLDYLEFFQNQKSKHTNVKKDINGNNVLKSKHVDFNLFEVPNVSGKNKIYWEKFETNVIALSQESVYYETYCTYESDDIFLDQIEFEQIVREEKYFGYYEHYKFIIPIRFAFSLALSLLQSKFKFKLKNDYGVEATYTITQSSYEIIELLSICVAFDTLDIDNFGQNRFYKKRIKSELISIFKVYFNTRIYFNETLPFDNLTPWEMVKFWEKVEDVTTKIVYLAEEILLSLCFMVPCISYTKQYGNKYTEITEDTYDVSSPDYIQEINNDLNLSNDKNELNQKKLKFNQAITIHSMEKSNNWFSNKTLLKRTNPENNVDKLSTLAKVVSSSATEYRMQGIRYTTLSQNINIHRDYSNKLYTEPPFIENNKVRFNNLDYYDFITYNNANDISTSKIKFNFDILKKITTQPINFDYTIFKEISELLKIKFNKKSEICSKTRYESIALILDDYFNKFKNRNFIISLYFPYIMDFRGRIYITSPMSITDVKLLRYIISPRLKSSYELKTNFVYNHYQKHIKKLEIFLEKSTYNLIKHFSEKEKVILLVGFVNLAKIVKSTLLKKDIFIDLETFIITGISLYNIYDEEKIAEDYDMTDLEDIAYFRTTKKKIDNYIKSKKPFSIIIDSTASGIQHLSIWLSLSEQHLKYINMSDEPIWYDTYSYLYTLLLVKIRNLIPENLLYLFTRKRLKKIFMTLPYNATHFTLFEYFCELMTFEERLLIKEHLPLIIKSSYEIFNEIFKIKFKELYKSDRIISKNTKNGIFVFELCGFTFDFTYYKTQLEKSEIKFRNKDILYRWTKCKTTIISEDKVKSLEIKLLKEKYEKKIIKVKNELENEKETLNSKIIDIKTNYTGDDDATNKLLIELNLSLEKINIKLNKLETSLLKSTEKRLDKINKEEKAYPLNYDKRKSERAIVANIMHCSDATYLRILFLKCFAKGINIHTIHDEFIIPVESYFEIIELANESFKELRDDIEQKQNKNVTKSLFILL